MEIKPEWKYTDESGKAQLLAYAEQGVNGFYLANEQSNADAVIEAIRELGGYFNQHTVIYVVGELNKEKKLKWEDRRRRTKSGELALDANADSLTLKGASKEQLYDLLKQRKPVVKDEIRYSWQLPLDATRAEVLAASSKVVMDWAQRRRKANLPDSV